MKHHCNFSYRNIFCPDRCFSNALAPVSGQHTKRSRGSDRKYPTLLFHNRITANDVPGNRSIFRFSSEELIAIIPSRCLNSWTSNAHKDKQSDHAGFYPDNRMRSRYFFSTIIFFFFKLHVLDLSNPQKRVI